MAKRESVKLVLQVRQADGSLQPVDLLVHPPTVGGMDAIVALGENSTALQIFAVLLSRSDPTHGDAAWLKANVETEDMPDLVDVIKRLMPEPKEKDPNAESPSP